MNPPVTRSDAFEIVGFDRTEAGVDDIDRWTTLVTTTLVGEEVEGGRLDLIFVDEDEMAELNQTHMGHEGPTDVLSFPLDGVDDDDIFADLENLEYLEDTEDGEGPEDTPRMHLGDIVICPTVANRQAVDHAGSEDAEMALLIIHGTLHILGHDHAEPDETDLMQGRERIHMKAAGFTHPRWGAAT